MTAQHTPGPWKVQALHIIAPGFGWKGAIVGKAMHQNIGDSTHDTLRAEANVRLQAAAPDMLAALKAAWDHGDMPVHIRAQVSDAIAIAEGRANG